MASSCTLALLPMILLTGAAAALSSSIPPESAKGTDAPPVGNYSSTAESGKQAVGRFISSVEADKIALQRVVSRTTMKPVHRIVRVSTTSPKPRLMVVFGRSASNSTASRRHDTMDHLFLYDEPVQRASSVPEEPSDELLPPFQDAANTFLLPAQEGEIARSKVLQELSADGYDLAKPQQDSTLEYHYGKVQQNDSTTSTGYQYQRPLHDTAKPGTGYQYPKLEQEDVNSSTEYQYPKANHNYGRPQTSHQISKPQQDTSGSGAGHQQGIQRPGSGYRYPSPQQDVSRPDSGYRQPKPQHDLLKPAAGYLSPSTTVASGYLKPQQDDSRPDTGYDYPKPQQDVLEPEKGYKYPKPQQDAPTPDSGYNYPMPQQDATRPELAHSFPKKPKQDAPSKPDSAYHYQKPQPELEYQYPNKPLQDAPRPETGYRYTKPHFDDPITSAGYQYPKPQPSPSYEAASPPWRPLELDYLPPRQELPLDEVARPPYGQPQDELPYSYLPPRDELPPLNTPEPLPTTSAPQRDERPPVTYVPPKQTLRDDEPKTTPISITYLPAIQTSQEDFPNYTYKPLKPPAPLSDQKKPSNVYGSPTSDSYGVPMSDPLPTAYGLPRPPDPVYLPGSAGSQQDPVPTLAPSYFPARSASWSEFPPLNDISYSYATDGSDDGLSFKAAKPRHLKSGLADEHGIRVTDMSCLRTSSRARFTATITSSTFIAWPPVLDSAQGPPPPGCRVIADPADPHHRFLVDLSHPDLTRCGVKGCSGDGEARLCTRVLVPTVPGLRLAADPVLLLQCSLQPATGSTLQRARLAAGQPVSGRAAGAVHAGGERANLHAQLQLFRRGPGAGDFTRQMQPGAGAAVLLGDELQLRAVVRRGDGWQSSRLSDVVVRRLAAQDAVHIVSPDGCTNPDMHAVCPRSQAWLAGEPLVSLLTMRVFMFRGMQDGEHLLITARIVGCLDRGDCKVDGRHCGAGAASRRRRSAGWSNLTSASEFEDSVSFQVRVPAPSGSSLGAVRSLPVLAVAGAALLLLVSALSCSRRCCGRKGAPAPPSPAPMFFTHPRHETPVTETGTGRYREV